MGMETQPIQESKESSQKGKSRGEARDFPVTQLEDAIEVAKRVKEFGEYATMSDMQGALDIKGGALARKISSTKRWGLIEGKGQMKLTALAKMIFYPTETDQPEKAKVKAFLSVKLFKTIYERFRNAGQLPSDNLLKNTLITQYRLDESEAATVVNIVKKSISTFIPFEKDVSFVIDEPIQEFFTEGRTAPKPDFVAESGNLRVFIEAKSIYPIAKNIGRLEEMAKNENVVEIKKEDFIAVIKEMLSSSSKFPTLHTILLMTDEEIENDIIPVTSGLKRIKFIVKNFESDIHFSENEKESETK